MSLMKSRSLFQILALVSLCLLVSPKTAISGETPPAEVVQAAADGLQPFLKAIPSGDLRHYGFVSQAEFAQATLGEPFRVYTIAPDEILNYNPGMELASLVTPTNLWYFPVFCFGEARTILTVDLMNGEWQAVAIGNSGLARQLERLRSQWPQSDGYEHKFVRVFQAQSDFLIVSEEGTVKISPLDSAALALGMEKLREGIYGLHDPADIIPRLAPIVEENLRMQATPGR
jgi:hypothetical protein